jgi:hypothetical protein
MNFLILPLLVAILTLLPESSSATGRILWDESHRPVNGFSINNRYQSLTTTLRDSGYSVEAYLDDLARFGLWNCDILVCSILSNYESAYTEAELGAITHFVETGGSLIILSDNSVARPRNISDLAAIFGVRIARDDRISNMVRFSEGPPCDGLNEVTLASGSALELMQNAPSIGIGFDANNRIGMTYCEFGEGKVVIIGDGDVWSNDLLASTDNRLLALNAFDLLDREVLGRIELEVDSLEYYLPVGRTYSKSFLVRNIGEGTLAYRISPLSPQPIEVPNQYGSIPAHRETDFNFNIVTTDLEPNDHLEVRLLIRNNDPEVGAFSVPVVIHTISAEPDHFDTPAPTGVDHSLLIAALSVDHEPSQDGTEIGVFTPRGTCAGAARYLDGRAGLAARGDDPNSEEIEGFQRGEEFSFRLFTPWDGRELRCVAEFQEGDNRFSADGFSILSLVGSVDSEVTLQLDGRWNLVSLNVVPASLEFADILAPLIESGRLGFVKSPGGRFWDLRSGFSNLGTWDIRQAYYLRVNQPGELTIGGVAADRGTPIPLHAGWNGISYLPPEAIDIPTALTTIIEHVQILKRGDGAFWSRIWDWDGIGAMEPGYGYLLRLDEAAELVYPAGDAIAGISHPLPMMPSPSDLSMSLIVRDVEPGSSISAYWNGLQVGAGSANPKGVVGLAVWGDDPATGEIEGAPEGAEFTVLIDGSPVALTWLQGAGIMHEGELVVATPASLPGDYALNATIKPNPFNETAVISVNPRDRIEAVRVFTVTGRLVVERKGDRIDPSGNQFILSAEGLPAGVLMLEVVTDSKPVLLKAVHLP